MQQEECIIVGAGPCGLSAAIELKQMGKNPLVIEKGNIVNAIYRYPTHQTFFSTSEKLEIGDIPFLTIHRKPKRNEALTYYREVVKRKSLRINRFETVRTVQKKNNGMFSIQTDKAKYESRYVIIATGYYDSPNMLGIKGEDLPKVFHYFKEAHPYFDTDVVVIGGKNSAIDAALELQKAGARVTVLYRGSDYSPSIKPWVLPDFEALVRDGEISMQFHSVVKEITETSLVYVTRQKEVEIPNDFVFAMTGYHPDHSFITSMGVRIDERTGRPHYDPETMETNVSNLFIAGVIAAGNNANEIFIENGRFHGGQIAAAVQKKETHYISRP
ncbi:YpdA family putative bacillithiol disulfide reductase [Siminovitchia sediminis]|uniref:YpdA family putative bacillithiol disulfide reductase n=1 Tax=Siminovitchia sediminis TaxID=1274353 RepID=A0ABW4KFX6_9BACI